MNFRISDIKNFVITSHCRTISSAARQLEIGQPALSESIKRLEREIGAALFYRSKIGIQLTPTGKEFLKRADDVIYALKRLDLNLNESFFQRPIILGAHPTVAQYFLPRALKQFTLKLPQCQINLIHDFSRNIQNAIQAGQIDVGLVVNPVPVPDLVIRPLAKDVVSVWHKKGLSFNKLDCLICNPDLLQTQSILKKWKSRPNKIISTSSLELICQLVDAGVGMGIIPSLAVKLSKIEATKLDHLPEYTDHMAILHRPEFGKHLYEKMLIEALKIQ